jgi:hypothetical protein
VRPELAGKVQKEPEQNIPDPLGTGGGCVMTRLGPVVLLLRLDSAETIESAGFEVNPGSQRGRGHRPPEGAS